MPYYKESNILFIHIPKTGGTVIETQLKKKFKQTLYGDETNDILPHPYNNTSLQHQYYTTLYKYRNLLNPRKHILVAKSGKWKCNVNRESHNRYYNALKRADDGNYLYMIKYLFSELESQNYWKREI